jgi:hypothetical protein
MQKIVSKSTTLYIILASISLFGCQNNSDSKESKSLRDVHDWVSEGNCSLNHSNSFVKAIPTKYTPQNKSAACRLAQYADRIYPKVKNETESLQHRIISGLVQRRAELLKSQENIGEFTTIASTRTYGDAGPKFTIDVFLKPTCGKCAKFFLDKLDPFVESLDQAKMSGVVVDLRVRPFQTTPSWMPSTPKDHDDRILNALWRSKLVSSSPPTLSQLKQWYSIVKDHKLDKRYKNVPVELFSEIFEITESLTEKQISELGIKVERDSDLLPEDDRDAPSVVINGRVWRHLRQYHLNTINLTDLIMSWSDFK